MIYSDHVRSLVEFEKLKLRSLANVTLFDCSTALGGHL